MPLKYLERCSKIVQLKNQGERAVFERVRRSEKTSASEAMKRTMTGVARAMAEEINEEITPISKVLVVKPVIQGNLFVRDFMMVEWEDDRELIENEEDKGTLVVPKDPQRRQTLSRTLVFESET